MSYTPLTMPEITVGRWLPKDPAVVEAFVSNLLVHSRVIHGRHPKTCVRFAEVGENLETAISRTDIQFDLNRLRCHYRITVGQEQVYTVRALHPIVQEFQDFIESEVVVYTAFNEMFEQAPPPQNPDQEKIKDYVDLMEMIDTNLSTAPKYSDDPVSAMVAGVPYYGIISRFCNTPAGYIAFTHPGVNERFYRVFTEWHRFLTKPESTSVLNTTDGWLSPDALKAIVKSSGGDPDKDTFESFFECNPDDPTYGFNCYDDFFVKELHPRHRTPVFPDDPTIVNSACWSTVHKLYYSLKETDRFWIKNTPYSLNNILAKDELVDTFVGGTLLQAILDAKDYHRWLSPVNGTVVKTRLISGATYRDSPSVPHPTYYAARLDDDDKDLDVISRSQDFVSNVSTRALIFIQAEEPVGLMCFVGVGLGEVSTCNVIVEQGQKLCKGTELGQFHFGGSTHCLIFRRGLTVKPLDQDGEDLVGSKVRVGKDILTVTKQN
ncbi:Phophatidylserine decarboxylase-domain-containing protein [Pisolithus orientalis]|uniref:Phophatidylserine decarboxylase-domain-containing protein n=1 Tax=Pisolithus orientalis TaxID=936130 RepID=UPI0022247252|nr:Phophatidylserine decarboxylase-domain-containing protein [Pisolithus orientalis]KAI5989662.1 Phophatidylserine decarboxylase-domain-containing protein [Pisolithus orientalis]